LISILSRCIFLAVAREIQATLITADERFMKKMGKMHRISPLKDLDIGHL